jgi:hypothetical protein
MNRRIMISSIGLGTAGLTLSNVARAQQEKTTTAHSSGHSDNPRIGPMIDCAHACAETAKHCLNELREGTGDRNQHAHLLQVASACEEFCIYATRLEACENPLAGVGHAAAADACKICAAECEHQAKNTETLTRCAEACRRCEEHCRAMATSHGSQRAGAATTEARKNVDASAIPTPRRP